MSPTQEAMPLERPWKAVVASLLVFALLGPLLMRLIWRLSFYALGAAPDLSEETPRGIADVIFALREDMPYMHLFLGPGFLIVGAVLASHGMRKGRPPSWLAALPVAAFFGAILLYDLVIPPPPDVTPQLLIIPALSAMVAAVSCGLIARRFWRARKSVGA